MYHFSHIVAVPIVLRYLETHETGRVVCRKNPPHGDGCVSRLSDDGSSAGPGVDVTSADARHAG